MEWYYVLTIVLGILGLVTGFIWRRVECIDKKLANHLAHYREFFGRVDTTIQFFREHFEELDKALNEKKDKGI